MDFLMECVVTLRIKRLWLKLKICEHNWNREARVLRNASKT